MGKLFNSFEEHFTDFLFVGTILIQVAPHRLANELLVTMVKCLCAKINSRQVPL